MNLVTPNRSLFIATVRWKQYLQRSKIKLLQWYAFLMAFPAIVIIQNISVFIFPFLLHQFKKKFGYYLRFRHFIQIAALFFALGSVLSVLNLPGSSKDSLSKALEVLPNYLYWSILILFLVSHHKHILYSWLYKPITIGLLLTVLYVFVLQTLGIRSLLIFKVITPNTFAFILIIFSPVAVYYIKQRYGLTYGFIAMLLLTLFGFLSGSRSGSLLTFLGSLLSLYSHFLRYGKKTPLFLLLVVVVYLGINQNFVKGIISTLNPRVFDLLYETETVRREDRSLLVRLAMVEKAQAIYNRHPKYGIGLNNFTSYKIKIPGEFEGAEFILGKKILNRMSAHNSYFGVLAEGGLFLFIPLTILIGYPIVYFILRLNYIPDNKKPIFIGLMVMAVHLYFIFAIVNVFAWFVIGLANALASFRASDMQKSEFL